MRADIHRVRWCLLRSKCTLSACMMYQYHKSAHLMGKRRSFWTVKGLKQSKLFEVVVVDAFRMLKAMPTLSSAGCPASSPPTDSDHPSTSAPAYPRLWSPLIHHRHLHHSSTLISSMPLSLSLLVLPVSDCSVVSHFAASEAPRLQRLRFLRL